MLTLLIVSNESFGNGLSNGIDLRNVTAAVHPHSDIDSGELFLKHKRDTSPFHENSLARVDEEEIAFRIYC